MRVVRKIRCILYALSLHRRAVVTFFLVFLFNTSELLAVSSIQPEVAQFLADKQKITMCVDPDWMPYEAIDDRDQHIGMAADFIKELELILEIPIELYPTLSWAESMTAVEMRRCDILSLANETADRKLFLNFTRPYITSAVVIVAREEVVFVDGLSALRGKTLGLVKGYSYETWVRANYPDIDVVYVNSAEDALKKVSNGQVDAMIDPVFVVYQLIQELGLSNLKIVGQTELKNRLSIAVRSDEPLLLDAFQSGLDAISLERKNEILQRWHTVRVELGFDYTILWRAIPVVLAVILLFFYHSYRTSHFNRILAEKNAQLERISKQDYLTQVFNRVMLDEKLSSEASRAARYGRAFSLIFMDLDYFKRVNDQFGHQVGDQVLKDFASVVNSSIRETDLFGRWGGEEFLLLCPETNLEDAALLAEKLRLAIQQQRLPDDASITASFGVAQLLLGETVEQLVKRADDALYLAKNKGRNQVAKAGRYASQVS